MADKDKPYREPSNTERVPAAALHRHVQHKRHELELLHDEEERHRKEREQHAHFEFLSREFTEDDRLHIRDLTARAVHAGAFEVEILRFPASYLTDRGRAINNNEHHWPDTLTGYARSMHNAFDDIAAPLGYKMVARVLDYPNGMIGLVALFLVW